MNNDFSDIKKESESNKLGKLYPILLVEYDRSYKEAYLKEKTLLEDIFGDTVLRISHIGSTAVPGLISKPTIDILLEIKKDTDLTTITDQLINIGYIVNTPVKDIIMYIKGYGKFGYNGQGYHIHIREYADHNEFYFRDYLIAHPEAAKEYGKLKQTLQQEFKHNRDGYTYAKSKFINTINELARDEFKNKYAI